MGHIPKMYAYAKPVSSTPVVAENYTGMEYVYFGKDNLYPERMLELARNCAPLGTRFHALALMIAGNGVKFYTRGGEEIEEAEKGTHIIREVDIPLESGNRDGADSRGLQLLGKKAVAAKADHDVVPESVHRGR